MQLAPAGDRAVLVELGTVSADELHAAAAHARAIPGVVSVTPGHSSLYVRWDADAAPAELFERWPALQRSSPVDAPTRLIAVDFDGEDLEEFLRTRQLSRESFLSRVETLTLTARYLGFRAGFAYLDGWPEEWAMPRRQTSRPVKRGAFAIAGDIAGFYPIDSPGGWNVLGHTGEDLENAIEPGSKLRITPMSASTDAPTRKRSSKDPAADDRYSLVHSPLVLATTTPFDDVLARVATAAVSGSVTLLECPIAGPRIRLHRDAVLAWCDEELRVERVRAGEERTFGRVEGGLRGYLAIGDEIGRIEAIPDRANRLVIHAIRGPHDLGIEEIECEVTPHLDRVGIRLRPLRGIEARIPADLKSIGMQCGTVQLHPDGSLVAMGPEHPVTGGYLQPMTVLTSERWKLAQLRPGERVVLKASLRTLPQPPY